MLHEKLYETGRGHVRGMTRRFIQLIAAIVTIRADAVAQRVSIRVESDVKRGPMNPVWAWFGYDEPNYTYTPNGRKLLSALARISPVPVFVRTHNMLTSGDGTAALKWGSTNAYTEDAQGVRGRRERCRGVARVRGDESRAPPRVRPRRPRRHRYDAIRPRVMLPAGLVDTPFAFLPRIARSGESRRTGLAGCLSRPTRAGTNSSS
jgi:hypothetical protein